MSIKSFKSASQLAFEGVPSDDSVALSKTSRGDVFLREGAVCMRVETNYTPERPAWSTPAHQYAIINLQTGRVWFAEDCQVKYIKARVLVETE